MYSILIIVQKLSRDFRVIAIEVVKIGTAAHNAHLTGAQHRLPAAS